MSELKYYRRSDGQILKVGDRISATTGKYIQNNILSYNYIPATDKYSWVSKLHNTKVSRLFKYKDIIFAEFANSTIGSAQPADIVEILELKSIKKYNRKKLIIKKD